MGRVITKLNLNKTPQLVENNSLIFAKNIKLLKDGSIGPDFAVRNIMSLITSTNKYGVIGHIVGVNNKIYFFVESYDKSIEQDEHIEINFPPTTGDEVRNVVFILGSFKFNYDSLEGKTYQEFVISKIKDVLNIDATITLDTESNKYILNIKHNLSENLEAFWNYKQDTLYGILSFTLHGTGLPTKIQILEYNELTDFIQEIQCGWKYNGGKITGNVTVNNTNEEILTICEYDCPTADIPIKHINLARCKADDDESIYTQAPNVPITNLKLITTYTKTIPNGVYQFFIRYKIRENFYTSWFPCSKECFAGTSHITKTIQGQIKNINTKTDAGKSFVFRVEHLFDGVNSSKDYTKNFINYQIGFIISHDDAVVARSWKSFDFSTNEIYFDYDQESIQEISIDDILKTNYELFNVKNVTYFKNKLYIANYKETDFNPDLSNVAKDIDVTIIQKQLDNDDVISVGGSQLVSSGTYGNDVYDSWGGQKIISLFNSSYYNKSEDTISAAPAIDSKDKTNGLLNATTLLDYDINPDLCWINSCATDAENTNKYIPSFNNGYPNWMSTGYLTKCNDFNFDNSITFYDNLSHPFSNFPYSKYKWYWQGGSTKHNQSAGNGFEGEFRIYDNGMDKTYTIAINTWLDQFLSGIRDQCPATLLVGVYIISNGKKYYLNGDQSRIDKISDPCNFAGDKISYWYKEDDYVIKSRAKNLIRDKIVGVKSDGTYVAYINGETITFSEYFIVYSEFDYRSSGESINDSNPFKHRYRIDCKRVNKVITCTTSINSRYITNKYVESQHNTLMPFTDYDFYIHFVKNNGIATNGYFIATKQLNTYNNETSVNIIYPIFSNIKIPQGYSSCFISIYKSGNDICKGFNHRLKADGYHYLDCLEADTLLYNLNDGITVINSRGEEVTNSEGAGGKATANYYSSGATDPISLFGNSGCIRWPKDSKETSHYSAISKKTFTIHKTAEYARLGISAQLGDSMNEIMVVIDCSRKSHAELQKAIEDKKKLLPDIIYTLTDIIAEQEVTGYTLSIGTTEGNIKEFGVAYSENSEEKVHNTAYSERVSAKLISSDTYDGYWIKVNSRKDADNKKRLIKLTPYLSHSDSSSFSYDDYQNLNMPGFVNKLYKLNRDVANNIYVSGNDIYTKNISTSNVVKLETYNGFQPLANSTPAYVPSNFNLNYCSLSEDLTPQIRSFSADGDSTKQRQMILAVQSLTSSFILELESMYRDYIRKYYSVYDPEAVNEFNNTIRSSDANTDEMYRNIYYFESKDAYNTPTNRGAIVNIFNIVNSIYVHTEHSLFKFSGVNTLSSNNGEVNLKEGDVFDTGITEVFDAQYGYAGLQNKHQSLVTFNSYIFYDKLAKVIYAYGGDNQIVNISEPIQKILESFNFDDIRFVSDDYNDRFFINLKGYNKNICLSYNFKVKSFVSIHDFDFTDAFNSRTHVYFIDSTEEQYNIYQDNKNAYNYYGALFTKSAISIKDMIYNTTTENVVENCIDIIFNNEYEIIKTLNYINWICSAITTFDNDEYMAEETLDNTYSGTKLKLYSDQCSTELIDLVDESGTPKVQNELSISDPNSYKYPRYNCGIWSLNFFRDVRNTDDIFNYGTHRVTQDKSLIYGKYFVLRMIFRNKNFKFENVNFNAQNYDKV